MGSEMCIRDSSDTPLSAHWERRWHGDEGEQSEVFRALKSHMMFPAGCLNAYTEEQILSALSNDRVSWLIETDIGYMREKLIKQWNESVSEGR